MNTGENQQALRKILDLSRMVSLVLLVLHCYYFCFIVFDSWYGTPLIIIRIVETIARTGIFDNFNRSRLAVLAFLFIALIGARGRKMESYKLNVALKLLLAGVSAYFLSPFLFLLDFQRVLIAASYILLTLAGWLLILTGGTHLSRIIRQHLKEDIFNRQNESFPQEERLITNEYSINLPARYSLKGSIRNSWINIINPFRGLLILGNPGSGKSYFIIRHIIRQHIEKHFTLLVYDFKYDDLSRLTYNLWLKHKDEYPVLPAFYMIQFDDPSRSNRCNPLDKDSLLDISDAAECARTILFGLNRDWIQKQGNFWVESPINFLTALIWFLCRYEDGRYCTLPHVIELAQTAYRSLFSMLRCEPQIEAFINPFIKAYQKAPEQLEGQIASATISLARLSSPKLYYVLTGNDLSLDINNPEAPKIVCMGNNPRKTQIYGAVLSLYMNTVTRLLNRKGQSPCGLVLDEFATLDANGIDKFLATARSNKVATTLVVQDISQLRKYYGREQAEIIMNIAGNIMAGQLRGDAAKQVSESIGKIQQNRESLSINSEDSSVTKSIQLDTAITVSRIASLSSGEFVGTVADNPDQRIALKAFCCELVDDPAHSIEDESSGLYHQLPVVAEVDDKMIAGNFNRIKEDVARIVESEIIRMTDNPALVQLLLT